MAVTIKDIAKLANVSTATVSRALNHDPRITSETREKVMACAKALDYRTNIIARSLKTNKTFTIGFICPEFANNFFMRIAEGVEQELRKSGYSLIVCNSNEDTAVEQDRIELLCEKCVDGAIVIPASNSGRAYDPLTRNQIPFVLVDRMVEDTPTDAVLVDNINGCYQAIEQLINQGHKRIGFIGGDMRLTSAKERFEGYKRALGDYCIVYDEGIVKFGDFHSESGYQLTGELMSSENPPTALFVANYFMHMGLVKYLLQHKNHHAKDMAVASFDDMELSEIMGYSSVRVRQPIGDIGKEAAALILARIHNEYMDFPHVKRLKTSLIY